MPIPAKIFLEQCTSQFLDVLSLFQKNCETNNPLFMGPFTFSEPAITIESEEDEQALLIASIYLHVFDLINQSLKSKEKFQTNLPQVVVMISPEKKIQLFECIIKLKTTKPLVWTQLCTQSEHRLLMYFFISSAILNPEWAPQSLCRDIIQSLHELSTCPEEQLVLDYLLFLVCLVKNPGQVLINDSVTNPHIISHFKLQFASSQEQLLEIASTPDLFSDKVPSFIQKLIHHGYVYMFLKRTFLQNMDFNTLLHFFKTLPPHFLSPHNGGLGFESTNDPIELIHRCYVSLKIFTRNYTLHLEQPFYTKTWFGYLSFYLLKTFKSIPSERKLGHMSLGHLVTYCDELIKTNTPNYWEYYLSSTAEFWEICGGILTYPGVVNIDFIHFTNHYLHTIIENLAIFKHWSLLKLFLEGFIERIQFYSSPSKPEWVNLIRLYNNLRFFHEFPFIPDTSSTEEAQTMMDAYFTLVSRSTLSAESAIPSAHLKKFYAEFSQSLVESMLEKLTQFSKHLHLSSLSSENLDALYLIQKKLHTWLRNIDASETQIRAAKQAIKEDALLELRLETLTIVTTQASPPTSPAKSKKKSSPAAASTRAATPTLVSTISPKQPSHLIAQEDLPAGLIKLANILLTSFETKVVLNGSAVTNLYLKRSNPSDYDCLIFGIKLDDLKSFLETNGYVDCLIVGKAYPVLKLLIDDEGQKLEIDISTISELKHAKFAEQMTEILSNRDFKLNALYLEIDPKSAFFEIKGFDHAIHSVNLKQISAVENKKRRFSHHIFAEDPLRAFRLVKILLQYPDFHPDGALNRILKLHPLSTIFRKFMEDDINLARIGTYLETLFLRFNPIQVIHILGYYKIIEGMTNIPYPLLKNYVTLFETYLSTVKPYVYSPHFFSPKAPSSPSSDFYYKQDQQRLAYTHKLCFFQFITTVYFIEHPKDNWETWQASKLVHKIKPRDQASLNMIYHLIHTGEKYGFEAEPNLMEFIESVLHKKFIRHEEKSGASTPK